MKTVEDTNARAALFNRIKGTARATIPGAYGEVACAAIDLAAAILYKRELSAWVVRMARFGIDDCAGLRDKAKRQITTAFKAFADAVANATQGKAVQA